MNLKKTAIALCSFALVALTPILAQADVFIEFPRTGTFTVSDGTVIPLPSYLNNYDHLALIGVADLGQLQTALQGQGVDPVPVGYGVGLLSVFGFHYRDTDFGAYDEVIVAVAVTSRDPANPRTSYYVHDIRVTQQLPLLVGRELLGLPKQRAHVEYEHENGDMSFEWNEQQSNQRVLKMTCGGCNVFPTFPFRNDFDVVSPLEIKRVWSRIVSEGQSAFKTWDPAADRLSLNTSSNVGAFLTQVGFYPTTWYIGHNIQAVDAVY